jgi:parallel beta-helix repeat protein
MTKLRRHRKLSSKNLLALPIATVLMVLGLSSAFMASDSRAAGDCTLYASNVGSDSNDGSSAHPFATAQKLISVLASGQTGCLASGQTFNGDVSLYNHGGSSSAPVIVTSTDQTSPATIYGRVVTHPGADYITFTHLNFNWNSGGQNVPSITIGSEHISLTYNDIQNQHTAICISAINDPTWGIAKYTLIDHNRIHNCGPRPVTSYSSTGYFAHGIYVIGYYTTIINNYIYDNSNRGIQLRGSQGAVVEHNTIDGNGSGIIFGDLGASNNEVAYNLITNSTNGCACASYGAFSWWGTTGTGTGNSFHDNCVYGNQAGDIDTSGGGYSTSNNKVADPLYVDRASQNYALKSASPCAGYGADGMSATASPVTTTATATTTSTPTTTTATTTPTTTTTTVTSTPPTTTTTTAPTSLASPTIVGSTVIGSSMTASAGPWAGTPPIAFDYQWQHCAVLGSCTQIAGATSTSYTPSSADLGMSLRVAVSASNSAGSTAAVSDSTSLVTGPFAVQQTIADGSSLSASIHWRATTSAATDHVDFLVDGNILHTEKFAPYGSPCDTCLYDTSTLANGTHVFTVKAYATSGPVATMSSTVSVTNVSPPVNLTAPSVSGDARRGSKLTGSTGTWSGGAMLAYSYNWLRCDRNGGNCSQIASATLATYVPTSADVNSTLRIMVTAQNSGGSVAATSSSTARIQR